MAGSYDDIADTIFSFLDSLNPVDSNNSAIEPCPPMRLLTSLARVVLGALDTVRDGRHGAVGRLLALEEEERRRLAAEIHDDAIQAVAAASIRVQLLGRRI